MTVLGWIAVSLVLYGLATALVFRVLPAAADLVLRAVGGRRGN
ncbi:hypothetical protein AB0J25_12035 [Streptomyces sp. NPDC049910]